MLKLPNDKYIPFIGLEYKSYNGDNYMDLLGQGGKYVIYRTDQPYFLMVNNLYYRLPLLYHWIQNYK